MREGTRYLLPVYCQAASKFWKLTIQKTAQSRTFLFNNPLFSHNSRSI